MRFVCNFATSYFGFSALEFLSFLVIPGHTPAFLTNSCPDLPGLPNFFSHLARVLSNCRGVSTLTPRLSRVCVLCVTWALRWLLFVVSMCHGHSPLVAQRYLHSAHRLSYNEIFPLLSSLSLKQKNPTTLKDLARDSILDVHRTLRGER